MSTVCSTSRVFHYFLHGAPDMDRLLLDGLQARPVGDGGEEDRMHREVYAELFEPALRQPYRTPGVFFTPIDFRGLTGTLLHARPRVGIDVAALDPGTSVLTWQLDGPRTRELLSGDALRRAASIWTEDRVREWFGRDRTRLFWHVPQIGCFGGHAIPVTDLD